MSSSLPARFERPSLLSLFVSIIVIWFIVYSLQGAELSLSAFLEGLPEMARVFSEMLPPDISRLDRVFELLLVTLQMAVAGTFIGLLFSLPLAVFNAKNTTTGPVAYSISRAITSLFRTIPDLVWALFFVVTVGIGSFAGVLTIAVDTIGFCARFFAEGMEEIDSGPEEALRGLGAPKTGILFSYVFPASLPSFINTGLFSLEKAVRSSVVLGLVGAGGIGVELKVSMDTFQFDQAITIILAIFLLVLLVERLSSWTRSKVLPARD